MQTKVSLVSLIKFSKKAHIQDMFDNGTIYMNHVSEFAKIEDDGLRGDRDEALVSIDKIFNLEISFEGKLIGKADTGRLAFHEDKPVGNIFSMCALPVIEDLEQLKIDVRCKAFGDACLIILNVAEFVRRIKEAALAMNRKLLYGPVEYQDTEQYLGKWSLFKKPIAYNYQSEFRFLIKQTDFIGPVILSIGNLHDIAVMLESESIDKLKFERKQR